MARRGKNGRSEVDAAEQWLRQHDPEYAQRSKDWTPSAGDALEHLATKSERANQKMSREQHGSLDGLTSTPGRAISIPGRHGIPQVVGDGNYRRAASTDEGDDA